MLNKEKLISKINKIITDLTGIIVPSADYDKSFNDLGFDLLDKIEINITLERKLNIDNIPDDNINTLKQLHDYIIEKLEETK